MSTKSSCLCVLFALLAMCAIIAGVICLGLSLIWLVFGVSKNITLAYSGFWLIVGGGIGMLIVKIIINGLDD